MLTLAAHLKNLHQRRLLFEREVLCLIGLAMLVKPAGLFYQVLIARCFGPDAGHRYNQHLDVPICYT